MHPIAIAGGVGKDSLELVGIADPQNQGGGSAVSRGKAWVSQGGGDELMLTPAPALGFSGAAALDANGKLAGLALLKSADISGLSDAAPAAQAVLAPVEAMRDFLKANDVTFDGAFGAKAAVVRIICVRK